MFIRRRQYFVDRAIQGRLVTRTITQWFFCLLSISIMLLCWRIATHPTETFGSHFVSLWKLVGPAFLAAVLLLPMVVIDVIKTSNGFVGPALRLRNAMRQLARGEDVQPVRFRDSDLWQEMATDFNAILARLAEAESSRESQRAMAANAPAAAISPADTSAEESLSMAMASMATELAKEATPAKASPS